MGLGYISRVSFSPSAQWLCPSQFEGVFVVDVAADSGPIDRCCCCCCYQIASELDFWHVATLGNYLPTFVSMLTPSVVA